MKIAMGTFELVRKLYAVLNKVIHSGELERQRCTLNSLAAASATAGDNFATTF